MPDETKNGMQCSDFDVLLTEAIDETLTGSRLESFQAHARSCPNCGPLFAEADAGRRWLKSLSDVEPPVHLVHNILVATSGVASTRFSTEPRRSLGQRLREWGSVLASPISGVIRQPRFVMSFGMAFFSVSLILSVAGVKPADIKSVDLRPAALKRSYYETSGKVVRYYENIRFVYEIESRVRDIKRATTPAEPGPSPKEKERKNDTSEQPEQKQERNYSQGENQPVLASRPIDPPVVSVTTNRRFV